MMELAEDEVRNLGVVWASVFVSLSYCFIVGKIVPKGFARLIALLPVISLFLALPLNLTSLHLCGFTAFFITWLANFKLLLFAFGEPPLCGDPPNSFACFIAVACLPIKIQNSLTPKGNANRDKDQKSPSKPLPSNERSPWNYIIKATLFVMFFKFYDHRHRIPQKLLWLIFFLHTYLALELLLACLANAVKLLLGLALESQFNEPLLSTSLQDFWGRRWNLMVTGILRPTVYLPVLNLSSSLVGQRWAPVVAVMAAFLTSGLMHELIYFYLGRARPTFEVTWFFFIHGTSLCLEILAKRYIGWRWRPPRWLSTVATLAFMATTGQCLFMPPLLRAGLDTKGLQEYAIFRARLRSFSRALGLGSFI